MYADPEQSKWQTGRLVVIRVVCTVPTERLLNEILYLSFKNTDYCISDVLKASSCHCRKLFGQIFSSYFEGY